MIHNLDSRLITYDSQPRSPNDGFQPEPQNQSVFAKFRTGQEGCQSAFKLYLQESHNNSDTEETPLSLKKLRGSYRKYTVQEKQLAVQEIMNGLDVQAVSKKYGIPRRNLLRWRKNGCQRKRGGGRPTDSQMETILFGKIKGQQIKGEKLIRQEAMKISRSNNFKASKGWYAKFCQRYQIQSSDDL